MALRRLFQKSLSRRSVSQRGFASIAKIDIVNDDFDLTKRFRKVIEEKVPQATQKMFAMYNSNIDAVTTNHAFMNVPIFDRGFTRGHCVFDTTNIMHGLCYGLDLHLDRFIKSAEESQILHGYSRDELRQLVLHTIAASGKRHDVYVRMYLTAGLDMFPILPAQQPNAKASLIICVVEHMEKTLGSMSECSVTTPLKPSKLATIKTNNYLLNTLAAIEASNQGGTLGLQLHADGTVAEQSIGCIGLVDSAGTLKTPHLDHILRSTTLVRTHQLIEQGAVKDVLPGGLEFASLKLQDLQNAQELLSFGAGQITAITKFNGENVGSGSPGPATSAIFNAIAQDMKQGPLLESIPYHLYGHDVI